MMLWMAAAMSTSACATCCAAHSASLGSSPAATSKHTNALRRCQLASRRTRSCTPHHRSYPSTSSKSSKSLSTSITSSSAPSSPPSSSLPATPPSLPAAPPSVPYGGRVGSPSPSPAASEKGKVRGDGNVVRGVGGAGQPAVFASQLCEAGQWAHGRHA